MKVLSARYKRSLLLGVVALCAIVIGSISAMAASKSSVQRTSYQGETHTGLCCKTWDPTVTVTEPDKLAPIVVTFSADYRATGAAFVALKLNGGPCVFFGPASMSKFAPEDGTYNSKTFQWVIMPGDYKLVTGPNTIQVCGGGIFSPDDTVTLGFNTLSAEVQK